MFSSGPTSIWDWPPLGASVNVQDYPTSTFLYLFSRSPFTPVALLKVEEYDGDGSSSGDLAQGFGNMELFRPGRDISENHLLMTRISKSCVVTWIIRVRARTQIWCSGSSVLFLHDRALCYWLVCVHIHTRIHQSASGNRIYSVSVRSISRDLVWWRNGGCHAVKPI